MKVLALSLLVFIYDETFAFNLPGPLVYVVTPSSKPRIDEGRSAPQPFYYHNWMRRMDSPQNATSTTTTTTADPSVKTPDLIFAEFESDNMKNIRKLLEKERISPKKIVTTTAAPTSKPIYVPEEAYDEPHTLNYGAPSEKNEVKTQDKDMTDYFALYNNMYDNSNAPPVPVYLPSTTTMVPKTTTKSTTTTTGAGALAQNVENIWHIIDSQKHDQNSGQWQEVPVGTENNKDDDQDSKELTDEEKTNEEEDHVKLDENFALPGFGTNSGIGGENESRAIRTEPNIRFPYVNLKPFQVKNPKKPLDMFLNSKKGNNMYTNLDNFVEVKHPVRGEVQDTFHMNQPVDRYNPAQPYLPGEYGSKSKQPSQSATPTKTVANLVPPPPPLPPRATANDFPAPITYERYPPFAPSGPVDSAPPPFPPASKPTLDSSDSDSESDDDSDSPPMDLGYRYKPPSAPTQNFLPTLPPLQKPSGGYSYNKPPMFAEAPSMDSDFQGYQYDKPPAMPDKPDFSGYHYNKPEPAPPKEERPSYGHHGDGSDYPELIFDKPHGGMGDTKNGDDDAMGMVPPPMADMKPGAPDDSGFPQDFPGDFKYHHDFDDHDFHHYHHHHPTTTTTTTTTEMPRVNRYSYYYLGKKLYYLPLYFSVYFIIYVGALIIKAVLRHKIVYPNSWRPNDMTASFFSKRSVDTWDSGEQLHEITGKVTHAIATAAERYMNSKKEKLK